MCPTTTQPLSQQEFLQSATLPLVCINQGATLSVIFMFFYFFHVILLTFLLQGMHAEIQSGNKMQNETTEIQKHNCP